MLLENMDTFKVLWRWRLQVQASHTELRAMLQLKFDDDVKAGMLELLAGADSGAQTQKVFECMAHKAVSIYRR